MFVSVAHKWGQDVSDELFVAINISSLRDFEISGPGRSRVCLMNAAVL